MSINRKEQLKKLAGAVLGAVSMGSGMAQNISAINGADTRRDNSITAAGESTSDKLLIGGAIGTAALGALSFGLRAWNMNKKDDLDEQYKKLLVETATTKKEQEEKDRKLQELRKSTMSKLGLSQAEKENLVKNINALRAGDPLDEDHILPYMGSKIAKELVENGKKDIAVDVDCQEELAMDVAEAITASLTPEKICQAMAALSVRNEHDEDENVMGNKVLARLTITRNDINGRKSYLKSLKDIYGTSDDGVAEPLDTTDGPVAGFRTRVFGTDAEIDYRQLKAGDALLPDELKPIFGGSLPVAILVPELGMNGIIGWGDDRFNEKEDILRWWKIPQNGGKMKLGLYTAARRGAVEMDLLIGKGIKEEVLESGDPVARLGIGQIDETKNKSMTGRGKAKAYAAIAQYVSDVAGSIV